MLWYQDDETLQLIFLLINILLNSIINSLIKI
jgi:hypothetical protein